MAPPDNQNDWIPVSIPTTNTIQKPDADGWVSVNPAIETTDKPENPGLIQSFLEGGARGFTSELPSLGGSALEFAGSYLPEELSIIQETGRDLKNWADEKGKEWYGEEKERTGLSRVVYEGTKMLAPSIIPGGIVGTGAGVLKGVGTLVKLGKAAEVAGDIEKAARLLDAAKKAAKQANTIASAATAGMFGLSQAQSTVDSAEKQAAKLEQQGDIEGARKVRGAAQGMAPLATGGIEATGEFLGTKYLGKLFGLDEAEVVKRGAGNLVKDFLKTLGVEVGTEIGQAAGEAGVEKYTAIRPDADPLVEALDVIGPTAFMTLLTGGLASGANKLRQGNEQGPPPSSLPISPATPPVTDTTIPPVAPQGNPVEILRQNVLAGKMTKEQIFAAKHEMEKHIPGAEDEINQIIIDAEGNKLFAEPTDVPLNPPVGNESLTPVEPLPAEQANVAMPEIVQPVANKEVKFGQIIETAKGQGKVVGLILDGRIPIVELPDGKRVRLDTLEEHKPEKYAPPEDTEQIEAKSQAELLDKYDNTGEIGSEQELIEKLKERDDLSDAMKVAIMDYEKAAYIDRTEYGMRSDLPEQAAEKVISILKTETALPAPLSQTDAATVGTKEVKAGESLKEPSKLTIEKKGSENDASNFKLIAKDNTGKKLGSAEVYVDPNGIAFTDVLETIPEAQRQGVMTAIHDHLINSGLAKKISYGEEGESYTDEGQKFYESYARKNPENVVTQRLIPKEEKQKDYPELQKKEEKKQPWQQTKEEYTKKYKMPEAVAGMEIQHEKEVRLAIEAGKAVPPEVLAQYPNLTKAKKEPKPQKNIMEKAPPGGWTEADKVPEKYRKPVKTKSPYGLSGMVAFNKIAEVAGLKDQAGTSDYNDLVNYFEKHYNQGLQGKLEITGDIHPGDARAAYQAGKKDRERSAKKESMKDVVESGNVPNMEGVTYKTHKITPTNLDPHKWQTIIKRITPFLSVYGTGMSAADSYSNALEEFNRHNEKGGKLIGKNSEGQNIREDKNGVRYMNVKGVRIQEPVQIIPTRAGVQSSVDVDNRPDRFKTVEELKPKEEKQEKAPSIKIVEKQLVGQGEEITNVPDLSTKSTGDLVKDMFSIIEDHLGGERGSFNAEIDETLYQKLKPYLLEIVSRAKAKALDARAYLFGAVDSMPDGKAKDVYEAAARRYVAEDENESYEKAAINITPKERKALDSFYEGKKTATEVNERQNLTLTGGPAGAGKSTTVPSEQVKNHVHVNPDLIRIATGDVTKEAHERASELAKHLLNESVSKGYHTLYDSQLTNYDLVDKEIQSVLNSGGEVFIGFTDIDANTSVVRSAVRGKTIKEGLEEGISREVPLETSVKGYNRGVPTLLELYKKYKGNKNVYITVVTNNIDFAPATLIFNQTYGDTIINDQKLFDKLINTEYIKAVKGDESRYERKDSITEDDLDTEEIDNRTNTILIRKRNDFREKRAGLQTAKKGGLNEPQSDGNAGTGALESDESGNLPADGGGQGTRSGERGGGETYAEGNEDLDVGGLDGRGSVAGQPAPVHIQDSGTDGEDVQAGSSAVETPASEPRSIQLSGINPGNYRITEQDDIGSGTRGQKIDRNIAAIRLIKKLDQEKRYPTKEEQSILAKYVGWGGIKNVFDETSQKPQDQRAYADLKELLTKEEFFEARQSVLNAHYTSPQVIRSIYKIMRHFGFTGGNVLEPTYGAGNFIGLMPDDMAASSKWYGSELDPITAKIGQYLYPESQLIHSGFQTAEFPYGKFDAEIGNPPFGDIRITDTRKARAEINRMKIHNYVISKSGLHLRPGGISANVITTRFLDTADPEARDFLAKQFKFLGAIRLPNDAFAKNAGTEVTTDLVFFQRLMPGEKPDLSADWLTTGATMTNQTGEEITLNKYFADHPEMMLGEPSMKGTMYGGAWKTDGKGEFTLNKIEGQDIEEAIDKIIREQFFELKDVARSNNDKLDAAALSLIPNKEDVAVGGFFMDKDRIFMREDNDEYGNPTYTKLSPKTKWTEKQLLGETRYNRIKGMLAIRAKAYELVNAERFDLSGIEDLRKDLNTLYDAFVKEHGFINESSNFSLMSDDVKIEFGLEIDFKKEVTRVKAKSLGIEPSPASAEKSTILKERMFFPEKEILYAKDSADGYNISLSQKGKLDIDYIAKLTGAPKESVIIDLAKEGLIYQDPDTKEWIQEDEYLSGNVKEKYKKVEGKEGFEKNAKALKSVFPADVPTEEIFANPGATWIPAKQYEQFGHFIGVENPSVSIYRNNGQFVMRSSGTKQNDINISWNNPYYALSDVFNAVANNKVLIAWDGTGDERVQNKEQSAVLANIVKQVRSTFFDWVFADDTRSRELTKIYNDTQNTHAKRKNDGSHLQTVGASPALVLRYTQRDAAWRIIQSKRVLLDHCVGAGKTYTIITGVQERVRMGLTRKAMIAVPNHLVGQWAADYIRLYPGARILAATKKDFSKPNRRRLFARIATGKYDAVIVGHSSFGFIPLEPEAITNLMMEEIAQLEQAEAQAKADGNKRLVKTLANRIAKKREKITELLGKPKDNVTTFEAMGIDHLVVDESHEFKNLEYSSAMQNITGMRNPMGSKRAFDLYSKIRWLTAQKDYALNFATGTPISNSLVEMYALLRYMNRDALHARGVDAFDSWANTYASIEPRIEYTASQKLKQRTVMATFNNLPELLQLYEEFADIVTMADLKRIYAEQIRERNARTGGNESEEFPIPKVKGDGRVLDVAEPSQEQTEYVDFLVARAERLEELGRQNDPKVDNHLWIMSDARKMALDVRLVDPTAKESPNNKINRAAKNIKEIYDRTAKDKGAQLVFCDLSTPSGMAHKNAAIFIREALKKAHLENDARTKAILDSLSTYQEKWGYLRNRLEAEIESLSDHSQAETDQFMKRREEIEDYLEKVTDDVTADLTTADTGFSVYDDLKNKLIMAGIPEGEVKFIHSANTEQQKEDLFAMVNSGQVRVLLGSSQKMGAGMNVQERLVALHHMDAPWRPSDVEQREGRLVRQGNKLYYIDPVGFRVEIKAYSTSNTFDAVMWQILARKGGMLDDFRSGRRSVEEVSTDGASYSDFMAETTGNPAFKEKFQLEGDIETLEAIKNRTATRLRSAQQSLDYNKDARIKSQEEIKDRDKIIDDLKGQSTFTYDGKTYKDNGKAMVEKEADEIAAYNKKVNNEYAEAIDAAVNKALEDKYKNTGLNGVWIRPEYPWNAKLDSKEMNDYRNALDRYSLFMDLEETKKIIESATKGIKKTTNKHFHSLKLAKNDKTGTIAAGLKMVEEINALDDGETITYKLGNTEIEIKKTEAVRTFVDGKETEVTYTFGITADGIFVERTRQVKSFDEREIWDLLNVGYINNRMAAHNKESKGYIERMDQSDETSRHTLKSLQFKDEEKLNKMKSRYQEVLTEVQKAEQEISDRRASTGNKYIQNDRPRFPSGVWEPKKHGGSQAVISGESDNPDIIYLQNNINELNRHLKDEKKGSDEYKRLLKVRKEFEDEIKALQENAKEESLDANIDLDKLRETKKEIFEGLKEEDYEGDELIFKYAEVARAEAILSQHGEGSIENAQRNLKEAKYQWDEFHEGEAYPQEITLAQHIITSISQGQQRLFQGQLYSGLDITQTLNVLRGLKGNLQSAKPHIENIGRKLWAEGKQTYDSWFLEMKKTLADLWRAFKPLIRAAWNKIREERGSISFEKKEGQKPVETKEPEQTDPPVSKDKKVLNFYLKDETEAIKKTIYNKLHPKDMTQLELWLRSPEYFSNPQFSAIVKLFERDRNEIYHETFNDLNMTDDVNAPESTVLEAAKALRKKNPKDYERLQAIIDEGDTTWKRNIKDPLDKQIKDFEEHIRKQGANDETVRVWKLYRQSYDKALDLQTRQLRNMIAEVIEEAHFKGETPDISELKQSLKGALAMMEEWRGFYAPRLRETGDWKVQAYKEHGPLKENREWYREHRGSELAAQRLAKKLEREGWKIWDVGTVERLPETIYQDVNAMATAKLIDKSLEKLSRKSDLSNDLVTKFNEEILREVSDAIKARGFRSTMISRGKGAVVRGFVEDPILRHLQYINSLSGGISKARVARLAMKELLGDKIMGKQVGGIDPVKLPKTFSTAQDYIQEQLRNSEPSDRIIGLAKSIATFKFLGFNLRSLAVNMTAVITTAPAAIHQYAMGGKGSMVRVMNELARAGKDYGSVMAGRKLNNAGEQAFIEEFHKKGWDDAQYTREALGELSKTHSRIWSSMMDGSMYLFGKSEKWNRGTTMLAAYRVARRQGMAHVEAAEAAKVSSDKAHGVYGKSTLPMWAQGTNPAAKLGQMMYVYSKFGHNYLQMLYDLGFKRHNAKAAMFAFLSPLVLAGGAALPFKDVIFAFAGVILRSLFGVDKDPEKWVWDIIREHLGADAEKFGRHGLTGAAGVDISGSLSIGVGVPKNFIDLTGAIGGVFAEGKEAIENIGRGDFGKAAEHLLPSGFANPVRAIRESAEGVTTRNNRRVWNEKGKPFTPGPASTVVRALGFRSTDQAVLSERTWEGHKEQAKFAEKRSAIYEEYRSWLLGGKDDTEHKAIMKKVREFNNQAKEADGVSRITFESLRRQTTALKKPNKKERAILKD